MSLVDKHVVPTAADGYPRWLTLGNQLGTDQVCEPDLLARIRER